MHDEMNSPTEHLRYGYKFINEPPQFSIELYPICLLLNHQKKILKFSVKYYVFSLTNIPSSTAVLMWLKSFVPGSRICLLIALVWR